MRIVHRRKASYICELANTYFKSKQSVWGTIHRLTIKQNLCLRAGRTPAVGNSHHAVADKFQRHAAILTFCHGRPIHRNRCYRARRRGISACPGYANQFLENKVGIHVTACRFEMNGIFQQVGKE